MRRNLSLQGFSLISPPLQSAHEVIPSGIVQIGRIQQTPYAFLNQEGNLLAPAWNAELVRHYQINLIQQILFDDSFMWFWGDSDPKLISEWIYGDLIGVSVSRQETLLLDSRTIRADVLEFRGLRFVVGHPTTAPLAMCRPLEVDGAWPEISASESW